MKRQPFVPRPAMVRAPRRHGRRRLLCLGQTLMRRANVIDRAYQAHPLIQRQGWRASARQRRASGARRSRNVALSRSRYAGLSTPPPGERRRSVSTRASVPATLRRSVATTRRRASRLTTWASQIWRHGRSRGRPPWPVGRGLRQGSRMARLYDTQPSGQSNRGRRATPRLTRLVSRRRRGRSRCALTSPPRHRRVLTI